MTASDVHKIAYITMHGWTYHDAAYAWKKVGKTQIVQTCMGTTSETDIFDLHEAYVTQLNDLGGIRDEIVNGFIAASNGHMSDANSKAFDYGKRLYRNACDSLLIVDDNAKNTACTK